MRFSFWTWHDPGLEKNLDYFQGFFFYFQEFYPFFNERFQQIGELFSLWKCYAVYVLY